MLSVICAYIIHVYFLVLECIPVTKLAEGNPLSEEILLGDLDKVAVYILHRNFGLLI